MKVLLRSNVQDFSNWGIEFLVRQLQDQDSKVAQVALSVLDEACDDVACLDSLIALHPPLLKMGQAGRNLLLRYLFDSLVDFLQYVYRYI